MIVPPSWIVKLPRKGSFKSSLKCSPNKYKGRKSNAPTTIQECQETSTDHPSNTSSTLSPDGDAHNNNNTEKNTPFCVKPIPSPDVVPILVFPFLFLWIFFKIRPKTIQTILNCTISLTFAK